MAGVFVRLLCTAGEEISPAYEEYTRCTAFDPVAHDPLIETHPRSELRGQRHSSFGHLSPSAWGTSTERLGPRTLNVLPSHTVRLGITI